MHLSGARQKTIFVYRELHLAFRLQQKRCPSATNKFQKPGGSHGKNSINFKRYT